MYNGSRARQCYVYCFFFRLYILYVFLFLSLTCQTCRFQYTQSYALTRVVTVISSAFPLPLGPVIANNIYVYTCTLPYRVPIGTLHGDLYLKARVVAIRPAAKDNTQVLCSPNRRSSSLRIRVFCVFSLSHTRIITIIINTRSLDLVFFLLFVPSSPTWFISPVNTTCARVCIRTFIYINRCMYTAAQK